MTRSAAPRLALPELRLLDPVSLVELDRRAALQHRRDNKYVVSQEDAAALLRHLRDDFQVLRIGGRRSFRYDTVYFDSSDLALHRAHVQGRRLRWKVRTRAYEDGGCYREVKLKGERGATVKLRERCAPEDHGRVTAALEDLVDGALSRHYGTGLDLDLVPQLSIRYVRSAIVSRTGAERVTLDTDLSVLGLDGDVGGRLLPGSALLEVKTPTGRGDVDRMLLSRRCRPTSLSKYGVGVALLRHDAPQAPLRAVLRSSFERTDAPARRPARRRLSVAA